MEGYFSGMVDNNYFGLLAIFCFVVGVAGLVPRIRVKKFYKFFNFLCVMAIPAMYLLGLYYLTHSEV
jgi:biotin transporter BioY